MCDFKNDKVILVSIITVVFNNVSYIRDAIQSVRSQNYPHKEHLVIDGGSTDGTVEVIKEYEDQISVFISEPDEGIYDALNKGIKIASGSIIAILHSDDLFISSSVVSQSVERMLAKNADICFSDMIIVNRNNEKIFRYYKSHYFKKWLFKIGWMPPHPTCFIKKSLFNKYGFYALEYKITADYDLLLRFLHYYSMLLVTIFFAIMKNG